MKTKPIIILLICIGLAGVSLMVWAGCKSVGNKHQPNEPYYFKSGITYQGYCPTREMTKAQANEVASRGYAYIISFFDTDGDPIKMLRVYKGETNLYWQTKETVE